jgi:hypothetical protein
MRNILSFIIVFGFLLSCELLVAQNETVTAQPTITVVPFATKDQSLRSVYESREEVRIALTKAKEAFDKRGVNTIDLIAKIKIMNNTEVLTGNQAKTMDDEVIANSGADIYVVVEPSKNFSSSGNSANVILTAYDAFSGESLANKTGNSPKIYTDNFEKLVEKAIEAEMDNLLNTIQEKFNLMHKNGRTVVFNIGVDAASSLTLSAEVGKDGDLLSDVIEQWVEDNSFKATYHIQGTTATRMTFDQIKVPILEADGKNFRLSKFASTFRKFMREYGVSVEQVIQGNTVVFTLSEAK